MEERERDEVSLNFEKTFPFVIKGVQEAVDTLKIQPGEGKLASLTFDEVEEIVEPLVKDLSRTFLESNLFPEFSRLNESISAHVVKVFIALHLYPEYTQDLTEEDKNLCLWSVLLHDISKFFIVDEKGERVRDTAHPFRCTVSSAFVCIRWGWAVLDVDELAKILPGWMETTLNATIPFHETNCDAHDNTKLPEIVSGLEKMFGGQLRARESERERENENEKEKEKEEERERESDVTDILKAVLFHQSLPSIDKYPPAAPLSQDEMRRFISPRVLRLLRPLMLADSSSYQLHQKGGKMRRKFEPQIRENVNKVEVVVERERERERERGRKGKTIS